MRIKTLILIVSCMLFGGVSLYSSKVIAGEEDFPDAAVLESVLVDILSLPESESPIDPKGDQQIWLNPLAINRIFHEGYNLEKVEFSSEKMKELSAAQLDYINDATQHLISRGVKKDYEFKNFTPKDGRIKLYTQEQQESDKQKDEYHFMGGTQLFSAYPPGYTQDRKFAVVMLSFGWSGNFHGAKGTYVLTKQGERWVVLIREFIHYF